MRKRHYDYMEEGDLLMLLKEGDAAAFDQIYVRYCSVLYTYAYKILRDREECRDVVQNIFIRIWKNREDLDIGNLKDYLIASVKYEAVHVIKASKRRSEILSTRIKPDEIISYSTEPEIKELKKIISAALSELPDRAKEVFTLSRFQYLSNKEIASKLGISEKTVENHITVSLRKLRIKLAKVFSLSKIIILFSIFILR